MSIGLGQLLIILIIVFILFGAGKIPQVMGDLGKGLRAFKENLNEPTNNSSSAADQLNMHDTENQNQNK